MDTIHCRKCGAEFRRLGTSCLPTNGSATRCANGNVATCADLVRALVENDRLSRALAKRNEARLADTRSEAPR